MLKVLLQQFQKPLSKVNILSYCLFSYAVCENNSSDSHYAYLSNLDIINKFMGFFVGLNKIQYAFSKHQNTPILGHSEGF